MTRPRKVSGTGHHACMVGVPPANGTRSVPDTVTRRGFVIWELVVSCLVLGVLLTVVGGFVRSSLTQRRAAQVRLVALQEAQNLLEDLCGLDWDALVPSGAGRGQLSGEAQRLLPEGRIEAEIDPPASVPAPPPAAPPPKGEERQGIAAKRIAVAVSWRPEAAQPELSVRLVAWKFQPAGTVP